MSAGFRAVQWNRAKLVYDAILVAGVTLYIAFFIAIGRWWLSPPDDPARWEDLGIRAFGTCAFLMLTIILSIGPLARLDRRLPGPPPVRAGTDSVSFSSRGRTASMRPSPR